MYRAPTLNDKESFAFYLNYYICKYMHFFQLNNRLKEKIQKKYSLLYFFLINEEYFLNVAV